MYILPKSVEYKYMYVVNATGFTPLLLFGLVMECRQWTHESRQYILSVNLSHTPYHWIRNFCGEVFLWYLTVHGNKASLLQSISAARAKLGKDQILPIYSIMVLVSKIIQYGEGLYLFYSMCSANSFFCEINILH